MPGRLKRAWRSVRVRLTLLVALACLPPLVVALASVIQDHRAASAMAHALAASGHEAAVARLEAALLRLDRVVAGVATPSAAPGLAGSPVCARWVASAPTSAPASAPARPAPGGLAVVDGRGRVLCPAPAGAGAGVEPAAAAPGPGAVWTGPVADALPALARRVRPGGDPIAHIVPQAPAVLLARPLDPDPGGAAEGAAGVVLLLDGAGIEALVAPAPAASGPAAPPLVPALLRDGEGRALRLGAGGAGPEVGAEALPFGLALLPAGEGAAAALDRDRAATAWRLAALAAGLAAAVLAAILGAGPTLLGPLSRLSQAVDRWRGGAPFRPAGVEAMPRELQALCRSFAEATGALDRREAELREAISRQGLLMQEIHHRVKNNLQIIASLLNLQANRIRQPQARAEFQSARDRVRALATLHRHLYAHEELHTINMRLFLTELCGQLFQAMGETEGKRIALSIAAPEVQVSSDQAVPLALIVTEAVSNAVKYAFPHGRSGHIWVHLTAEGEGATLEVRDDGVGIAAGREETEAGTRDGLGLTLIRGFARQLGASLTVEEGRGTRYLVRLPLRRERAPDSGAPPGSGPTPDPAPSPAPASESAAASASGATVAATR